MNSQKMKYKFWKKNNSVKTCLPGQVWRHSDKTQWDNLAKTASFGSKAKKIARLRYDSAWFCVEKFKKPRKQMKQFTKYINNLRHTSTI